jgi:hypothetical protein
MKHLHILFWFVIASLVAACGAPATATPVQPTAASQADAEITVEEQNKAIVQRQLAV